MEPRGCKRWQSSANRGAAEAAETSETVATGCHPLPEKFHGKQGLCGGLPPFEGGTLSQREGVKPAERFGGELCCGRTGVVDALVAGGSELWLVYPLV